jgi:hypothetical protein
VEAKNMSIETVGSLIEVVRAIYDLIRYIIRKHE